MSGSAGHPVRPFSLFVFKIHSRCNLACSYCYVYEHADQSWRSRPITVSDTVVDRTAEQIGRHAAAHRLPLVRVVLHGGEPLLVGPERLAGIARRLRAAIPDSTVLDLRLQTNGVLLAEDEEFCRTLHTAGIKVGISIDGDRIANDRHRLYRNGASSFDQVVQAVRRLGAPRFRAAFSGLLCTIDVENDPVAGYEALAALDPPRIDFLLPHANWDIPPPRPGTPSPPSRTPYADWLIAIHRRWIADGRRTPVRFFDSIRSALAGTGSLKEGLGTEPCDLAVVETDGAIELADSLKTAYHGAPHTGFSVLRHSFDEAAGHPGFALRDGGVSGLAAACRRCPVVDVCGGGLYAHRYSRAHEFDNPSVYCADLLKIVTHVADDIRAAPAVAEPPSPHTMTPECFDDLAAGFGDASALNLLASVAESINRKLLAQVYDTAREAGAHSTRLWAAVEQVEHEAPEAFRRILTHPFLRAWATECLTALRSPAFDPAPLAYLRTLIISAAAQSGTAVDLDVTVTDQTLHLPMFGTYGVPGAQPVDVDVMAWLRPPRPARLTGRAPEAVKHRWRALPRLSADGLTVLLDDADPCRDRFEWPVTGTLPRAEIAAWNTQFDAAWQIIRTEHPGYAPALAAGLSAIVPLTPKPGRQVGATARLVFGAVAVSRPRTPDELALQLIHEFQHVKLGTLLDMFDLYDPGDSRLYTVPWREDRRPAEAVLQGLYAHAAVAEVWRARESRPGADAPTRAEARENHEYWRPRVVEAASMLLDAEVLTDLGARLVRTIADRAD